MSIIIASILISTKNLIIIASIWLLVALIIWYVLHTIKLIERAFQQYNEVEKEISNAQNIDELKAAWSKLAKINYLTDHALWTYRRLNKIASEKHKLLMSGNK